jgi:GTP-binding protein Era
LPAILVINKTDKVDAEKVGETIKAYSELHDFKSIIPISAVKNDGVDIVLKEAEGFMQEGEWFFPESALTDQPERQIAAETIREKLLRTLDEEIPHGTAVIVDTFEEGKNILKINATIYCEKETHKGIIIGKRGETLKKIGTYAREDMEAFFDTKVYLNIWVKVKENWRDSQQTISNFGFKLD